MKPILIISAVFPPEPLVSARLSFDIASELIKKTDVFVISPRPTRPFGFEFNSDFPVFGFKYIRMNSYTCPQSSLIGRFVESFSFGRNCYNYLSKNSKEISLILVNTWPLFSQYYVVKASKKFNIPLIMHIQDVYPESLILKYPFLKYLFTALLLPIDKYILKNADRIIAISDKMKDYLATSRQLNREKIIVIQNWQNEEEFINYKNNESQRNEIENVFTFMYLGNIGPVAGVELLIDSFINANLVNCRLVIAGSGSMKESLRTKVKEFENLKVEFWSVPEGKVPEIQSLADVMLLPITKGAASSSIPSKLPAYMFSSKPIIACVDEDSDTAMTILLANCGWIVPPQNVALLSKTMSTVYNISKESLENIGKNGFHFALTNLSRSNNLPKVISLINEVAEK